MSLSYPIFRLWNFPFIIGTRPSKLAGLYPGNPKRATERPTTEVMLRAFEGVTLTLLTDAQGLCAHVTPLSALQQRLLQLLGFSPDLYWRLSQHFSKPVLNLGEP
jgi:hypothetical protein